MTSRKRGALRGVPWSIALLVLICARGSIARAQQCFGGDQLDYNGTCCQPATPNLPVFPAVSMPGLGVCWTNCAPTVQRSVKVDWTAPVATACGQYVSQLVVTDNVNGQPSLTGTLVLDYTRTWQEIDPQHHFHQVWRFAVKADLSAAMPGIAPPCPAAGCLAPAGSEATAFYYGYLDYVQPCTPTGLNENALVLYHGCDFFVHDPNLSAAPGSFHPQNSYAIVAPHSLSQPFLAKKQNAPSGGVIGEATRVAGSTSCFVEDGIASGQMTKLGGFCFCAPPTATKQYTLRQFTGTNKCKDALGVAGSFQSQNYLFPTLPWFHLTTTAIGAWTSGSRYPGNELAFVDEGLFLVHAPCGGDLAEIYYGGTTQNGWQPIFSMPILSTVFTDLASNYSTPVAGPYPLPAIGRVQSTTRLIYVNTP